MPSASVCACLQACRLPRLHAAQPTTLAQRSFKLLSLYAGGIAQLLAGMWEARRGKIFGATAFSSYGAFWISYGLFGILSTVGSCCAGVLWSGISACRHGGYKIACGPDNTYHRALKSVRSSCSRLSSTAAPRPPSQVACRWYAVALKHMIARIATMCSTMNAQLQLQLAADASNCVRRCSACGAS
jgi:GPR1/FUN34/yaaH family